MNSTAASFTFALDRIMEFIWAAQTEIAIFVIAFATHALFFGRHRYPVKKSKLAPETDLGPAIGGRKTAHSTRSTDAKDIASDAVTCDIVVKTCLEKGAFEDARKAAASMTKLNCATFNELLDAASTRCIDDVSSIIELMKTSAVKPNQATYSTLSKIIQGSSNPTSITKILATLEDAGAGIDEGTEGTFIASVEAYIRAGRSDLLASLLKKHQLSRKNIKSPHALSILIRAYGLVGDTSGVWETWSGMRRRHISPTSITLGCTVEALTTNGDVDASYDLIHEMLASPHHKPLVNSVIYGSVLKGFSHQKRFDRVWSVYQEMISHNLSFSIVTFNTLMDACARSGQFQHIPGLLETMTKQGIEPNIITYSIVIKGYCQENKLKEALDVWQSMLNTTKFKPDEIMYNTILDGCARQGLYERGLELLNDMENAGVRPSNFTLSVLVKLVSRSKTNTCASSEPQKSSRSKMLDRAFELCEQISKRYKFRLNVHVFNNLVQACVGHNDLPRAFAVLDQMVQDRVHPDVRTYTLIIRASISMGEGSDAAGLVRTAMGLDDGHPRLSQVANFVQLQKGLPSDLLIEVLENISTKCHDVKLAISLWKDVKHKSKLSLPPQLQFRLARQAIS